MDGVKPLLLADGRLHRSSFLLFHSCRSAPLSAFPSSMHLDSAPPVHPFRSLCSLQGRRRAANYYARRAIRCALLINFCRCGRKLLAADTRPSPLSVVDMYSSIFPPPSIFFQVNAV